ncbi:class I SAM-dependent methyltransferase [Acinetobacter sp. ASP199]|uniref:class I SAM-dependent methyltransferase n=1 Tax=unclassified Acinetobacter TaxID=196816 RepID=UPI001F60B6C9|nr:class I SAM-dependent methyltransferase [Acinetobacter sp. ASP199]UNT59558.1 class I SAM-dependent methyltransferase [Acinetobacter sp. ASP199]
MTQSLHPAAKQGFSSAAERYQQVRPSYPEALVPWLQQQLGLTTDAQLLDLGSGTGKFLPQLKFISSHILAVDPVAEMLTQLKRVHPDIPTLQAMSDALPLENASIHAVFCAQSFHWFANLDSLKEIHRILKDRGYLVLIWNQRDVNVGWVKALADFILPMEGDTPRYHSGQWHDVFQDQQLFRPVAETTLQQIHSGTVEQVVSKRLLSTSFIAAQPDDVQQQLKSQFEQIVLAHTGKQPDEQIDFPYVTHVYIFQKIPTP